MKAQSQEGKAWGWGEDGMKMNQIFRMAKKKRVVHGCHALLKSWVMACFMRESELKSRVVGALLQMLICEMKVSCFSPEAQVFFAPWEIPIWIHSFSAKMTLIAAFQSICAFVHKGHLTGLHNFLVLHAQFSQ